MGLDNIPAEYPCKRAGTAILTEDNRIDCDATIAADQCPWKKAGPPEGGIVGMVFSAPCWWRGKAGTYMLDVLASAGERVPEHLSFGFYGDDDAKPNLSPEYCRELADWMADRSELYLSKQTDAERTEAGHSYHYAVWWLRFAADHAGGANSWY